MQICINTLTGAITLESFFMPIIFVKTPTDKTNIIDVNWDGFRETLADVKAEIQNKKGIHLQRLFFAGKQLKNSLNLVGFIMLALAEAQEEAEAAARRTRRVRVRKN